jgi:hypothetical protein
MVSCDGPPINPVSLFASQIRATQAYPFEAVEGAVGCSQAGRGIVIVHPLDILPVQQAFESAHRQALLNGPGRVHLANELRARGEKIC